MPSGRSNDWSPPHSLHLVGSCHHPSAQHVSNVKRFLVSCARGGQDARPGRVMGSPCEAAGELVRHRQRRGPCGPICPLSQWPNPRQPTLFEMSPALLPAYGPSLPPGRDQRSDRGTTASRPVSRASSSRAHIGVKVRCAYTPVHATTRHCRFFASQCRQRGI